MNGTRTDEAGGTDGFTNQGGNAMIIAHQLHIHGIGVFCCPDDTEGVAGEYLRVKADRYIEILSGSTGESLSDLLDRKVPSA